MSNISYGFTNPNNVQITADPPLNPNIHDQKIRTPVDFHLSIKFVPNRKFTNGNITLTGRRKKLKMKERCDEILKQYGIFLPLKIRTPWLTYRTSLTKQYTCTEGGLTCTYIIQK